MVWIGDRTRQLTGGSRSLGAASELAAEAVGRTTAYARGFGVTCAHALRAGHVEYFRGIKNPIGCKVGPSMAADELKDLCQILNPDKVEGRLILITRYGTDKIGSMLPAHIKAVQESGVPVVWQCDGVHGNTVTASNKLKTRKFEDVMGECAKALQIHRENGSVLGGIHLELTGQEKVTECTGASATRCRPLLEMLRCKRRSVHAAAGCWMCIVGALALYWLMLPSAPAEGSMLTMCWRDAARDCRWDHWHL
jgi:3-deoxy-7-phosphoheptulonate synthase